MMKQILDDIACDITTSTSTCIDKNIFNATWENEKQVWKEKQEKSIRKAATLFLIVLYYLALNFKKYFP